jgi:hypothetical protein
MRTAAKVAIAGTVVGLAFGIPYLLGKKDAGDKLIINLDSFDVGLGIVKNLAGPLTLPKGVTFKVGLDLQNPSGTSLEFTQPFLRAYAKNKKGERVEIGDSKASDSKIFIPAKKSKKVIADINIPLSTMLSIFPDYLSYALSRIGGAPATRSIELAYTYDAYGFEQGDTIKHKI